jgi:hypothetical protein
MNYWPRPRFNGESMTMTLQGPTSKNDKKLKSTK